VHGASKDGIRYAIDVLVTEANSVTDNPLVFQNGDVVSGGNFHGQPVSQAMDFLAIAVSTLANISERRIEQMVNPDISGLPPFLARNPGLESGFMIPQVVAASLASENKSLAHPASVDTIPTSANREDHVSMGVTAARHAARVVSNTGKVLGIELLCAAQGLDLGEPLRPGKGVEAAYKALRKKVAGLEGDRFLAPDLAVAERLVLDGTLQIGGREYGPLAFAHFPAGFAIGGWSSTTGAVVLEFFSAAPARARSADGFDADRLVLHRNAFEVPYTGNFHPEFPPGAGRKMLYVDPVTRDTTWLLGTLPLRWAERAEIHPTVEEMYLLAGEVHGNRGVMRPGAYFWRPPSIPHGPYGSLTGNLYFFRTKGGMLTTSYADSAQTFAWWPEYEPVLSPELEPYRGEVPPVARCW